MENWRSIVGSYKNDEGTLYKILTLSYDGKHGSELYSWKWVKPEEIEDDEELTQNYIPSLAYIDAECQTETKATEKQKELEDIKVSFPVDNYQTFLTCFDDIVDPSYLEPPIVPSIIHKIDLHDKTAIVSYPNSTSLKSIDLYLLMSIDPVGVAKYLTSEHKEQKYV